MAKTYQCFDASNEIPPASSVKDFAAVLGYLNSKAALDPWTVKDWQRFADKRQFPAWAADFTLGSPKAQARQAVDQAAGLGWHKGRLVMCDMEAVKDLAFWREWRDEVDSLDFLPCWYGSGSAAPTAAEAPLRWLAEPDGVNELPDHYQGKQYRWNVNVAGGVIDISIIDDEIHKHGGIGPRHAPGAAATIRAEAARIIPHTETAPATAQTGAPTMSFVDTVKEFIDAHAPELEAAFSDAAKAAEAIDPQLAAFAPLFTELPDAAKELIADTVAALHTAHAPATPAPTEAAAPAAPAA